MGDTNRALAADLRGLSAEALITVAGMLTTLAVVGLNHVASQAGLNLLSLSFWLVVPVGAMIGGAGAASGYYLAARVTHTMPSRRFAFEMVAIGASAWFLSQWLGYYLLRFDDGTAVHEALGFWQFFAVKTEHMQLTLSARAGAARMDTGDLGWWGYPREALQLLGFLVGGLAIYAFLKETEACEECRKYCKARPILEAVSAERFDEVTARADVAFPGVADNLRLALGNRGFAGITVSRVECPQCHTLWVRLAAVVQKGRNDTETVKMARYQSDSALMARLEAAVDAEV